LKSLDDFDIQTKINLGEVMSVSAGGTAGAKHCTTSPPNRQQINSSIKLAKEKAHNCVKIER